jgi:hypothetical protein
MGAGTDQYLSNLKMKNVVSAGFGFSDKPQPKYGFDILLMVKWPTHVDYPLIQTCVGL